MSFLSPAQQQVLTLLAQGSTVSAAAQSAGVHRNTVANWRRSSSHFRETWATVLYEQAQFWRDEMQSLGPLAVAALRHLLEDEKSSPSVRLRAALAVLNAITASPAEQPEKARARRQNRETDHALETLLGPLPDPRKALDGLAQEDDFDGLAEPEHGPDPGHAPGHNPAISAASTVHNSAQPCTTLHNQNPDPSPDFAQPAQAPETAQCCTTPAKQPVRNAPCRCGSGLKYKKCCMRKTQGALAA